MTKEQKERKSEIVERVGKIEFSISTLCISIALCNNSALQLIRIKESKRLAEEKASLLRELRFLIDIEQKEKSAFSPNPPSGVFMTYGTLFKDENERNRVIAMANEFFIEELKPLTYATTLTQEQRDEMYFECLKGAAEEVRKQKETEIKFFNSQI